MKLKFKVHFPEIGIEMEAPLIDLTYAHIGFFTDDFEKALPDNFQFDGEDVMKWNKDEECYCDRVLSPLCGDEWVYFEKGQFKLFMSIDDNQYKEVEI